MKRALPLALALALAACSGKEPPAPAATAPAAAPVTLGSGVDAKGFDAAVRPQDDFFQHVNAGWLAANEIPADRSNYGSFTKLADEAEKNLQAIIEESAAAPADTRSKEAQQVGDLYASFMDEA